MREATTERRWDSGRRRPGREGPVRYHAGLESALRRPQEARSTIKAELVNPFVESMQEVFATMLRCEAKPGQANVAATVTDDRTVTALVGFSGPARGALALSLPLPVARRVAETMVVGRLEESDIKDAIGELANIIAGSAKARFPSPDGTPISLSLPTVVRGSDFTVEYPVKTTWIDIPFDTQLGGMELRVTLELQ